MKRRVLSIASTVLFATMFACKSSPEPAPAPTPTDTQETSQIPQEPMEQPRAETQTETPVPSGDQLHDQITAAFQQEEGLDASRIRIVVDDQGVVVLSGTVASEEEKRRAHELAHNVAGVRNVYIGDLEVDTSQATR
jgi:hypothetical protein